MTRLILLSGVLACLGGGVASAQVAPYPPYGYPASTYPGGRAAAIADQHRYETERLRAQAEANAALARSVQQDARLSRLELEAARRRADPPSAVPRPLYAPEQERVLREGAAARRARTDEGLSQIDDWLNRTR